MNRKLKNIATSLTFAFTLVTGGGLSFGAQTNARATAAMTALVAKPDTAKAATQVAFVLGQEMPDHSIFAGLTPDGKQEIFAMPTDLGVTMTFNEASKWVAQLNARKALGHDDWQIPSFENLQVLYKNQDQGKLKGTFSKEITRAKILTYDFPNWYWSSTTIPGTPPCAAISRFSDGEGFCLTDGESAHLSSRPVRLVATP